MKPLWEDRYAHRTQRMGSSIIREILKFTSNPEIISFAGGLPAPEVFPVEDFRAACDVVLSEQGPASLQYSPTEGYIPLREMLIEYTANHGGTRFALENTLMTSGSQQALSLLGKLFINRGDHVIVEAPTYLGATQAWDVYGAEYVQVETDEYGMKMDSLEAALRSGPKFIYALPNFQNPSGVTMSLERRHKLIELADQYGVPIIEDDPYGQLRYEGEHLPTLIDLDAQYRESDSGYEGNVIYLSTFSKILAPGIRLGWVIAPSQVISKLVQAKQGDDLHTPTFTQMIAYEISKDGFLDTYIDRIRDLYRQRRDLMLNMAKTHFPAEATWNTPEGGLFLWITLPEHMNTDEILKKAVAKNVAFVPGHPFYPNEGGMNTMRLNFSNASEENIEVGMKRLGEVLKEEMG